MTSLMMQADFELQISQIDNIEKPNSEDIFYFLNQAALKFVKTRYSGINYKGEAFEQSQKRMDDLRTLVKESTISTTAGSKPNSYVAILPADYFVTLAEEVTITFTNCSGNLVSSVESITECTLDTYSFKVRDPLEAHNLHLDSAYPLRMYIDGKVCLISDGNYTVPTLYLTYLKLPNTISISTQCDLPSHTHTEIVKIAVDMYLENISSQRINTYGNQINTME